MSGKGLTSVPLLRDVTPASDSAVSLRWFFKVDVEAILEDGLNRLDELATERGHHRVRDEAIEPPVDDLGLNQQSSTNDPEVLVKTQRPHR